MMNLFSPAKDCKHKVEGKCPTAHKGDGKIFNLAGTYCACEQGPIEKLITRWYEDRLVFKKNNDPREYTVKILLNTIYGISGSSIFKSIYYEGTGQDTTLMSKQSIVFMKNHMESKGYIVVSGDTDSLYLMDPFRDKVRMEKARDEGIQQIIDVLPFADKYYGMGIDAEFSHIFFFLDDTDKSGKQYKKKNYIYILKNGKIKLNGLPIIKGNASKLAKIIYTRYLEPEIKKLLKIKFDKEWLQQLIDHEVNEDFNILAVKYNVKPMMSYANPNQLQARISEKYLNGKDGLVKVIKHKRKR